MSDDGIQLCLEERISKRLLEKLKKTTVTEMGDRELKSLMRNYHLPRMGFKVYPHEMMFNGAIDVVGMRENRMYAFELKSLNDSLSKGIEQCINYIPYFHYTLLVSVRDLGPILRERAEKAGVGHWIILGERIERMLAPRLNMEMNPSSFARFYRYAGGNKHKALSDGQRIIDFFQEGISYDG